MSLTGAALAGSVLSPVATAAASSSDPSWQQQIESQRLSWNYDEHSSHDSDFNDFVDEDGSDDGSARDDLDYGDEAPDGSDESGASSDITETKSHLDTRAPRTRPMSSGEQQYRNGCRSGYLIDGCEQYDVTHLLRRGIDPFG